MRDIDTDRDQNQKDRNPREEKTEFSCREREEFGGHDSIFIS